MNSTKNTAPQAPDKSVEYIDLSHQRTTDAAELKRDLTDLCEVVRHLARLTGGHDEIPVSRYENAMYVLYWLINDIEFRD